MFKKIKLIPLFALLCVTNSFPIFNLATYDYKAASVLPIYTELDQQKYVILTREAWGKDKDTYDDFSGGRDKGETDPKKTAAREFWEEAILRETLGWSLNYTEDFIDPQNNNTLYVIAHSKDKNQKYPGSKNFRSVTYIVNFDTYGNSLLNHFYDALTTEKIIDKSGRYKGGRHTLEKDQIAVVLLDNFKKAIIERKKQIQAKIINPKTHEFYTQTITLRPFLISKLRPYFLDKPYEQGENEKIRHYKAHQ